MEPTSEAWAEAVRNSPGGMAIAILGIIVLTVVIVRYALPLYKELRLEKLKIDRYRVEVDERAAQALDDRERERIRTTQSLADQQRQTNELVSGMKASLEASTAHTDVLVMELRASRDGSKEMGNTVSEIDQKVTDIDRLVTEMHQELIAR